MFYGILAAFAALAVILDQVTKYLVVRHIPLHGFVQVWPGVFHLTQLHNTGMAFSLLEGGRWLFLVLTAAALGFMVLAIWKKWVRHPLTLWSLAAIMGGAVGNLIDRVFLGYVVDMIAVDFVEFAVFNVADCFVVCGGILLAVAILFFEKEEPKKEAPHDCAQ